MDDEVDGDVPGRLADAYLERERGIGALLDELERLVLEGEHDRVRDRIRSFAAAEREAFFAVALAFAGSAQFFGHVESQVGVERADKLRRLPDTYPSLVEPFGLVRVEVAEDRRNPVTGLEVTTTYHSEEEVPIVGYAARSGDVELYESRGSPQEVLGTATYLVEATNDALGAALDGDHAVNTDELAGLIDRRDELESELADLQDRIDELRRNPVEEE